MKHLTNAAALSLTLALAACGDTTPPGNGGVRPAIVPRKNRVDQSMALKNRIAPRPATMPISTPRITHLRR